MTQIPVSIDQASFCCRDDALEFLLFNNVMFPTTPLDVGDDDVF